MTVHSFSTQYNTENSFDNLPSYVEANIIAQMLPIGGDAIREEVFSNVETILPDWPGSL